MRIRLFRRISEVFWHSGFAGRGPAAAAFLVLVPALAQAAAQPRTFVSAKKGSDSAACSRTSPCRTFGRAIAVTTPGGEVVVLDSGGYGAVTVSQAVSLEAPEGVYAGITVSAGDGITVAAGASDVVVLRGLTLVGGGASGNGITIASAGIVHIENCAIRGFATGNGIFATTGVFASLHVEDTMVSECETAVNLSQASASPSAISSISLSHSRFENSQTTAMVFQGLPSTGADVPVFVSECKISGLGGGIELLDEVQLTLDRCLIASWGLGDADVLATGHASVVNVSNSVIPNASRGLRVNSSTFACVLGNNYIANIVGTVEHCSLQ